MHSRLVFSAFLLIAALFRPPFVCAQGYDKVFDFSNARAAELANSPNKGKAPHGRLIQSSDGNIYGTTAEGGANGYGTVFKLTPEGPLTTLVSFNMGNGGIPLGGLVEGSDGSFYGTTYAGGENGYGTVFKLTREGTLTTLLSLDWRATFPKAGLVAGGDGNCYGTISGDGNYGYGTVFRITPAGGLTRLYEFSVINPLGGYYPVAGIVEGIDGNFYGTTSEGGAGGSGTVFKMTPEGALTTLVSFNDTNGKDPQAELVESRNGSFYGTTAKGGASGLGTVFKMTPEGTLTTLVSFDATNGSHPYAGLLEGSDGNFYGTTAEGGASGLGTVFKMTPEGTLTTLVSFDSANGSHPHAGLMKGIDGNFYGTTSEGGANDSGTVFKITPGGVLTTLIEFTGNAANGTGSFPTGALVQGREGDFFGTTSEGGASGFGTVFKMTPEGTVTTLVSFTDTNGSDPEGALVEGSDGNFYGTTSVGGASDAGKLFKVTPAGTLTTLVSFNDTNGRNPYGGLVEGNDGNFYGTTQWGGASGFGTVFKMTPEGTLTTLVSFDSTNGSQPYAGLVEGSDGSFYGTTYAGGASGFGTVFKMTPEGALSTLVSFNDTNGRNPYGGLVEGSDGNLYGTTQWGGASGLGTVFKMTPEGTLTTLASFDASNGSQPYGGLVEGSDGSFYGTTSVGGASDVGKLFKVTAGGVLTTLVVFSSEDDGRPRGKLIRGSDGFLYGTRSAIREMNGNPIGGSIYRLVFPGSPLVSLNSIDSPNKTSATLKTKVNPRGAGTNVTLEYGGDGIDFPHTVLLARERTGYQTWLLGTTLENLTPGTTYYYRVRAVNSAGTTLSAAASFSTPAEPVVATAPASDIAPTSARFNGDVNARNFDTTVVFEWGTDGNSFPNAAPAVPGTVTGNADVPVSAAVAGLPEGGTVYYRLRATNAAGTVISGARGFNTGLGVNTAALGDDDIGVTDVTFKATINTFGQTASVKFKYWKESAPTTVFETVAQTVTTNGPTEVTARVTGLQENVAYSYRVSVELAGTETDGAPVAFTTDVNFPPEAVTDVIFYSGQVRFNPLENDTDGNVAAGLDPNLKIAPQLVRLPADSGSKALVSKDGKSITYTPGNDSSGQDSFAYRAMDSGGGHGDGEVRLIDFFLLAGYYSGVIPASGGGGDGTTIALQLGAGGVISTSFMGFDGERYPLKGTFGSNGRLSATFAKANAPGSTVTLTFQLLPDWIVVNNRSVRAINATFQEVVDGVPSQEIPFTLIEGIATGVMGGGRLTAHIEHGSLRAVSDSGTGEVAAAVSVGGDGYVVMTIGNDKLRRARVVGRLPDGEPFSSGAMAPFGKTYQLAATNLYRGGKGGMLAGRINVLTDPDDTSTADTPAAPLGMLSDLSWRRRASFTDRAYPFGIASRLAMEGLFYPESAPNGLLGILGNTATLTLSGGGIAAGSDIQVGLMIISPTVVQVAEPNPLKVKFKANPNTALYTGSFIHPTTRKLVKFTGAIQAAYGSAPASGRGCFLSKGVTGSARVDTVP